MTEEKSKTLTILEYIILGILSRSPKPCHSVALTLDLGVIYWRANSESTDKMLARLQRKKLVAAQQDNTYKKNNLYCLTSKGEELLDSWITDTHSPAESVDAHDVMLLKFLFAESRLTEEEVLNWLDMYLQRVNDRYLNSYQMYQWTMAIHPTNVHEKLIYESIFMERTEQKRWIQYAQHQIMNKLQNLSGKDRAIAE